MQLVAPQDRFTPDAGTVKEPVFCGVCSCEMTVSLNQEIPRGMVQAMAAHRDPNYEFDPCDVFECPSRSEDWHYQAVELYKEIQQTRSAVIEKLLRDEIQQIVETRKPTKAIFNPRQPLSTRA